MPSGLRRLIVIAASVAIVGGGTTLAIASDGGTTVQNASQTQYGGGQGCTPGYWKNNADKKGAVSWVGYSPNESFDAVFGVHFLSPSVTLLEALNLGGGGYNALARHAVAALLNSANGSVSYGYTTAEIIALVQEAEATGEPEPIKDSLAAENELTCPINAQGEPTSSG